MILPRRTLRMRKWRPIYIGLPNWEHDKAPCHDCLRVVVLLEASEHLGAHLGIGTNGSVFEGYDGC